MGEIHELFVLPLSLVWFAGATPDSRAWGSPPPNPGFVNALTPSSIQKRPEPQVCPNICPDDCFSGFQSGGLESVKILSENDHFLSFDTFQSP